MRLEQNCSGEILIIFCFSEIVYETPYSLLDNLSPAYREAFGQDLTDQLLKLQKQRGEEEEEEAAQ